MIVNRQKSCGNSKVIELYLNFWINVDVSIKLPTDLSVGPEIMKKGVALAKDYPHLILFVGSKNYNMVNRDMLND